ncbi:hypothetical protein CDD81_1593 [Ophiocordyceps australis]|uniref:Nitroreductase domain-containing protein n=1 Tax=Ophiocordyceps australis TaxID=1399860 RepID=A0A2C5XYN6_9HYPO|nr:hypothetical protein CDD81_1593 [Ophiocordyceps australis]
MAASKVSADAFFQAVKTRRTIYNLNKTLPIPASRIQHLLEQTMLHTPSSFNSQSTRAVLLLGAEHDKLWALTLDTLRALVPSSTWSATEERIAGFARGAGTVLFFSDAATTSALQAKLPTYADRFPGWAEQSSAMHQQTLWTALELEGLGANLQHYNPLIDAEVAKTWGVPESWMLNAQLVFGGKGGEAGEKEFEPLEGRVKIFGA